MRLPKLPKPRALAAPLWLGWSQRTWLILGGLGAVLLVLLLIGGYYWHWEWTGLDASRGPAKNPKAPFDYYPSKTLWDWMQLLLIPAVLVVAGFLLNSAQQRRERDIAKENRAQDLDIADKNRAQDLDIAEARQQEAALGEYLATMTTLLLDKELRKSAEGDEVRAAARAQTLTVLRRLNGERKGSVVRFLYESRLIDKATPIVDMGQADLSEVKLSGADLSEVKLSGAVLRRAFLFNANLSGADLSGATLISATLVANLSGAVLTEAYLLSAFLAGSNLSGADLSRADLYAATGRTTEQLEREAASLEGATMPDGSIHL